MIVFDKRSPVYEQIVAYFKAEIVSKRLKPGQEMPSRRELAQVMQVNPNTVQRAFHEMEAIGLVTTGNNVMSRVTEDEERIEQLKKKCWKKLLRVLSMRLLLFISLKKRLSTILARNCDRKESSKC